MKGIMFKEKLFRKVITGEKIQTRRVIPLKWKINWNPDRYISHGYDQDEGGAMFEDLEESVYREGSRWITPINGRYKEEERVYLKEPFIYRSKHDKYYYKYDYFNEGKRIAFDPYAYDKWKSKMFMPAIAARYEVLFTKIWVERVLDISNNDAVLEGVDLCGAPPIRGFISLWDQINSDWKQMYISSEGKKYNVCFPSKTQCKNPPDNGLESIMVRNPWVFVYEFILIVR